MPHRYTFWPEVKPKLPLLFNVASTVLGQPATSTSNESFHSVAAAIWRKQRASLTPENVERLALGRVLLTKSIKESAALMALELEARETGAVDEAKLEAILGE